MIAIEVNDTRLDLPKGFIYAPVIQSPLYFGGDFNVIPGTYTIPTTIRATDRNKRALGYPDLLSNISSFTNQVECIIYIDGNLHEKGLLTVQLANANTYKIQILVAAATLQDLKTKKLTELNFSDLTSMTDPQTEPMTDNSLPYRVFRIWNSKYLEHQDATSTQRTNFEQNETVNYWNGSDIRWTSLQPKLKAIIEQIFEDAGYDFETSFFNDSELADLIIYQNRMISDNFGIKGNDETLDAEYLPINMAEHMPLNIIQSKVLKETCKLFAGYFKINSNTKKAEFGQLKDLLNQTADDWSDYLSHQLEIYDQAYTGVKLTYSHTNDELADQYEDLKNEINQGTELSPIETTASLPVSANVNDYILVLTYNLYYKWRDYGSNSGVEGWTQFGYCDLRDYEPTTSSEEVAIEMSPMILKDRRAGVVEPLDPSIEQVGTQINTENDPGLRVMLYRGLSADVPFYGDTNIPYANNYEYDDEFADTFNHSLRLNGTKGIYQKHWKDWDDLLKTSRVVEGSVTLPLIKLLTLDLTKPIKAYSSESGTYHTYFIKEFKPSIQDGKPISGSITLIQVQE